MRILLVLLVLAAAEAHGDLYTWEDSRGVSHYTNRKDDIPVRYRSDAKILKYDKEPKPAGLTESGEGAAHNNRPERVIPQGGEQRDRTRVRSRRAVRDSE